MNQTNSTNFLNHYKIIDIPRTASMKQIKNKTKELLKNIKNSNISITDKKKFVKKVYNSYNFLTDYHLRKGLDDQLDLIYNKTYKIIDDSNEIDTDTDIVSPFSFLKIPLFEMLDLPNEDRGNNYFFSKTRIISSHTDKNGNLISNSKETVNNNGHKNTNEYTNKIDKQNIKETSILSSLYDANIRK